MGSPATRRPESDRLVPAHLRAPLLDRVQEKVGVVERSVEVAMRPDRLDRPVRDAREPHEPRVVLDESELEVGDPRRPRRARSPDRARACAEGRSNASRPSRAGCRAPPGPTRPTGSRRRRPRGSSRPRRASAPSRPAGRPGRRTGSAPARRRPPRAARRTRCRRRCRARRRSRSPRRGGGRAARRPAHVGPRVRQHTDRVGSRSVHGAAQDGAQLRTRRRPARYPYEP